MGYDLHFTLPRQPLEFIPGTTMRTEQIAAALSIHLPGVMRWAAALAKQLRKHNIALGGKSSGNANTDALTLADLTIQELLVGALRDTDPIFRDCRLECEEETGDLGRFASDSPFVISIDPIDGTKQYRDHTGNGYCVMLHLRTQETVHYSLVLIPELGKYGTWVEVNGTRVVCGEDDPSCPALDVLRSMSPMTRDGLKLGNKFYLIGFQEHDADKAKEVTGIGLEGVPPDEMPGSIYELMARGTFGGSLIHSPNVYDFPVGLHIARAFGGDAVWVHNREPVNFSEMWMDERAHMLRLPGIVACSPDREILDRLCTLAKDWNPVRYPDD
ncbi:MAG: inositol monophosphatase [Planctomycetota bacterium]|nr:inositol monophosphatase [Planctomycetota bacterium]MDA1213961.1 inositol monophosphatase [Planctomycetota bacterium]